MLSLCDLWKHLILLVVVGVQYLFQVTQRIQSSFSLPKHRIFDWEKLFSLVKFTPVQELSPHRYVYVCMDTCVYMCVY